VKTALLAFVPALILAYMLTPLVMRLARKFGVIDHPDERRVHITPTPSWGGLAIYAAFMIAVITTVAIHPQVRFDSQVIGLLLGGTIVAIAGLLDDKYDLSPILQASAIVAGGAVLIAFGSKIAYLSNPFGDGWWLHWLAIPVTIVWIFGVTKTVDLMDGLDGLAAGICAIASATLLVMTFRELDPSWAAHHTKQLMNSFVTVRIFSGALLGASVGFLRFNYPPAKIFMGTIGAQFMGFVIASSSVIGAFKVAALVAMVVPMLVLALPILDTAFVVVRRALSKRSVTEADKSHVHHRLLDRGLSHGQTIWAIYILTAILSSAGLFIFWYAK
jgi:UDP-GlcNAc:undecaprenyl-phosphate GlcNAc-1-phosphate transferase